MAGGWWVVVVMMMMMMDGSGVKMGKRVEPREYYNITTNITLSTSARGRSVCNYIHQQRVICVLNNIATEPCNNILISIDRQIYSSDPPQKKLPNNGKYRQK